MVMYALRCFFYILLGLSSSWGALAHEDFDLGVESIRLDSSCRAIITLVNSGRTLPESFYRIESPAAIILRKGTQQERMIFSGTLDKNHDLKRKGGRVSIRSQQAFADNPQPLTAELEAHGEFADHGGENNRFELSADCIDGSGQIAGLPLRPTRPDLAIVDYGVDQANCELLASIKNVTGVGMPDAVWSAEGAVIKVMSMDTMESIATETFGKADPSRLLGAGVKALPWTFDLSGLTAKRIRLALWYVPDDLDFKNNQVEVQVPARCAR